MKNEDDKKKESNKNPVEEAGAPRWTPEQEDAITRRNENLLISAAAGSGKTSVMVERIRRMVSEEDVPVESLLVVTFTKAAAAEMKDRIRASLSNALDMEDPSSARGKILREQLRNLPLAQISTFHAFGMAVIKRFFYLTDLDPGTRVGEETEFDILKDNSIDALLEEEFEKADPDFIEFMDNYSGDRSDYAARDLIIKASGKIGAIPHGMEWAYSCVDEMENIRDKFSESKLWRILRAELNDGLKQAIDQTEKAAKILDDAGVAEKAEQLKTEEVQRYFTALGILNEDRNPLEIMPEMQQILTANVRQLRAPGGELKDVYNEVKDSVVSLRNEAREIIKQFVKSYFSVDFSDMLLEIELDAVSVRTLLRLVERFNSIYWEEKKNEGIMDYEDIEHYALKILENDEAQEFFRNKFRYIFVDEYQDTNLMQEAIIDRIKGEDNLFMVGDIKQSIYKFRLAEPSIFQGKYERFKSGSVKNSDVIDLNRNHRSKSPIIDFINDIFSRLMAGYDKDARLYPGIDYDGKLLRQPEIHVLMPRNEDEIAAEDEDISEEIMEEVSDIGEGLSGDPESWDKVYLEAKHVAKIIKQNLGKTFLDSKAKGGPVARKITKRDIVVLMRAVNKYSALYNRALQEEGVDAYLEGDDGYFDTHEVSAFLNLLTVIDNLKQDVPLLSILHSGIFGFSSKELAEIRVVCREGSFSEAFVSFATGKETPSVDIIPKEEIESLKEKCKAVLDVISYWQDLVFTMPLDRFVWKLMLDSGCYITMGALPGGGTRQANLRALCDMAEKYTRDRQATLYGFLNYVNSVRQGRVKTPEVSRLSEGDDVVRIMTIHKSKGLEFPMVIVSGLGTEKKYGEYGSFSLHKDIGLALTLRSGKNHWQKKILIQSIIEAQTKKEEIEEEIRVLYVALTRARDILYLVGYEDKDISRFAEDGIMSNKQYMKMILQGQKYKVFYVDGDEDLISDYEAAQKDESDVTVTSLDGLTPEKRAAILERLNYSYPFEAGRHIKSKYSVTELNKLSSNDDKNRKEIQFTVEHDEIIEALLNDYVQTEIADEVSNDSDNGGLSSAERGTVYHTIFEHLDFKEAADPSYIDAAISGFTNKGIITEEELDAIDVSRIRQFFDSEIGKRAIESAEKGMLEKERPFTLLMEMDGQDILVQGVIDCYFREGAGDGLKTVLLDYKSNRIYDDRPIEEEIERVCALYRKQLEIYKTALVEAGHGPVDEVYLYLLDIGKAIQIK